MNWTCNVKGILLFEVVVFCYIKSVLKKFLLFEIQRRFFNKKNREKNWFILIISHLLLFSVCIVRRKSDNDSLLSSFSMCPFYFAFGNRLKNHANFFEFFHYLRIFFHERVHLSVISEIHFSVGVFFLCENAWFCRNRIVLQL